MIAARISLVWPFAAALAAAGCDTPPAPRGSTAASSAAPVAEPLQPPDDLSQADTSYSLALAIDLPQFERWPSGLYVRRIVMGDEGARARVGNAVALRYAGYLANGQEFDGSMRDGRLLRFVIGKGDVIDGLEEGVLGMRVGDRRRLVIPPALAYGQEGRPGRVPSRATLVFDVELVELK